MTGKEKFDELTEKIEQFISEYTASLYYSTKRERITELKRGALCEAESPIAQEILKKVADEYGDGTRAISAVFTFLSGNSLLNYIKRRLMDAAYEEIITNQEFEVERAIQISGFSDQAAFSKKFKELYGKTPKEAWEQRDSPQVHIQLTWENLAEQTIEIQTRLEPAVLHSEEHPQYIFGARWEKVQQIKRLLYLQQIYEVDDYQANMAYYAHIRYGVSEERAFAMMKDKACCYDLMMEDYEEDSAIGDGSMDEVYAQYHLESRRSFYEKWVKSLIDDSEFRYAYFLRSNTTVFRTLNSIDDLHENGIEDVHRVDLQLLDLLESGTWNRKYCMEAYWYFCEHAVGEYADADWDEYLDHVIAFDFCADGFYEALLLSVPYRNDWESSPDDSRGSLQERRVRYSEQYYSELEEYYDAFDRWAEQETGCEWRERRFDEDFWDWDNED